MQTRENDITTEKALGDELIPLDELTCTRPVLESTNIQIKNNLLLQYTYQPPSNWNALPHLPFYINFVLSITFLLFFKLF